MPIYLGTPPTENEQAQTVPRVISTSYTSKEFREFSNFQRCKLQVAVTAISGSGASLTVDLQVQNQFTLTWASVTPAIGAAFAGITTVSDVSTTFELYDDCYRVVYTVAGSSPSITFTCHATLNCEEPVF